MRALIGLGNPGPQYQDNRHNLGFVALEAVAEALGVKKWKQFKEGQLAEVNLAGEKHFLFKPMSFMNNSGKPIRQLLDYYNLSVDHLCILADDVYVAPGSARIRRSGGDGGHNGWRSVLEQLGPDAFWRVRIGAGTYEQHPAKRQHLPDLESYVLQPLDRQEAEQVKSLIDKLVPFLLDWLERGELREQTLHFVE